MNIKGRKIGKHYCPLVVAEIGINHGGDIDVAKHMAQLAFKSGAECIKHQTHFVEDEMTKEAKSIYPPNADISIWEVMENCSLSKDHEIELKNFVENLGMIYISTPFSRSAADFLQDIDVPAFKIGSGEADNIPLIRHITKFNKPIIMSTGMHSISSIRKSVEIIQNSGVEFALLECTNLYPSPPEIVSLMGIKELQKEFPHAVVGFSDHSIGPYIALASVALGASIIERHFTDSRYRKGPDICCSMDPSELKIIIENSKEIFITTKNAKSRSKEEESVYKFARGSIVADKDLQKGCIISELDIWCRRPGNGEIPANNFDNVIGKKLKQFVRKNTQLKWSDFE
ncbi:N-acetylneuraminate synthase family protein [Prochlorococcus sp. AH-716-I05]|nr:N-acetylneuraminate synthase family protein [Prochlorococcus sp. AH-716-I05]